MICVSTTHTKRQNLSGSNACGPVVHDSPSVTIEHVLYLCCSFNVSGSLLCQTYTKGQELSDTNVVLLCVIRLTLFHALDH